MKHYDEIVRFDWMAVDDDDNDDDDNDTDDCDDLVLFDIHLFLVTMEEYLNWTKSTR